MSAFALPIPPAPLTGHLRRPTERSATTPEVRYQESEVRTAPAALKRTELVKGHWRDHKSGVIAIAIFNPLAYILVLYALTFTPVVYVAPTREISVLLTVLMGSILLGEGDLKRRMVWAAVILCGVVLLATA